MNTPLRLISLVAAMAAFSLTATAQPQAAAAASGPAASAPRMGMGPGGMGMGPGGMGKGGGMGGGMMRGRMQANADNTPGWAMMTPQEREEHHKHMMEMKSHDECVAYMDQHRKEMAERAKERGLKTPGQPRRDMCAGLK